MHGLADVGIRVNRPQDMDAIAESMSDVSERDADGLQGKSEAFPAVGCDKDNALLPRDGCQRRGREIAGSLGDCPQRVDSGIASDEHCVVRDPFGQEIFAGSGRWGEMQIGHEAYNSPVHLLWEWLSFLMRA